MQRQKAWVCVFGSMLTVAVGCTGRQGSGARVGVSSAPSVPVRLNVTWPEAPRAELSLDGGTPVVAPRALSLVVSGEQGFRVERIAKPGDVIELEAPLGRLSFALTYTALALNPNESAEEACAAREPDVLWSEANAAVDHKDESTTVNLAFGAWAKAVSRPAQLIVVGAGGQGLAKARVALSDARSGQPLVGACQPIGTPLTTNAQGRVFLSLPSRADAWTAVARVTPDGQPESMHTLTLKAADNLGYVARIVLGKREGEDLDVAISDLNRNGVADAKDLAGGPSLLLSAADFSGVEFGARFAAHDNGTATCVRTPLPAFGRPLALASDVVSGTSRATASQKGLTATVSEAELLAQGLGTLASGVGKFECVVTLSDGGSRIELGRALLASSPTSVMVTPMPTISASPTPGPTPTVIAGTPMPTPSPTSVPGNNAPVGSFACSQSSYVGNPNSPFSVTCEGVTDPDGDALVWERNVTQGDCSWVTASGPTLMGTLPASGRCEMTLRLCDPHGACSATWTPSLSWAVNSAPIGDPVCGPAHAIGRPGQSFAINCSGVSDTDGDALSFQGVGQSGDCSALQSGSQVQGIFGSSGTCEFRVKACDTSGACGPMSSAIYRVSSFEVTANLGVPTLSADCMLRIPLSASGSANVTNFALGGATGIPGLSGSVNAGMIEALISPFVAPSLYNATGGVLQADVSGQTTTAAATAATARNYQLNEVSFPALSRRTPALSVGHSPMPGMQSPLSTTFSNQCIATSGTGFAALALGSSWSCALNGQGGVQCWGHHPSGFVNSKTPAFISAWSSGVRAIQAGENHMCAIVSGGMVQCMGDNASGQLSNIGMSSSATPAPVSGIGFGAVGLALGKQHTCVLTDAGGVKCWGNNSLGTLGNATTTASSTPVDVAGLSGGVVAVSSSPGANHTCALTNSGSVKCWGANAFGQLGMGSTSSSQNSPVDVLGLSGSAVAIAVGNEHSCALMNGGNVMCWGAGGSVGDASNVQRNSATFVNSLFDAVSLSASAGYTCGVQSDRQVKCWGANDKGQLGDGTLRPRLEPSPVQGMGGGALAIATGPVHACALMGDGSGAVKCWGLNDAGQIGNNMKGHLADVPVQAKGFDGFTASADKVFLGTKNTCGRDLVGGVKCWGVFDQQHISAPILPLDAPNHVGGAPATLTKVVAGDRHLCALDNVGDVHCRGDNTHGQLGNGTNAESASFVTVSLGGAASDVVAGAFHTCALISSNETVKCWGKGSEGRLGNSAVTDSNLPVQVSSLTGVTQISAGANHTCAVAGGGAKCWGLNTQGQVGNGGTTNQVSPATPTGLISGIGSISAGGSHTCAVTTSGAVKCWGLNVSGQLGDGTSTSRNSPTSVHTALNDAVTKVAAGGNHTCVLQTNGNVKCWGANLSGQLGVGIGFGGTLLPPATALSLGSTATDLDARGGHSCIVLSNGAVKCWGDANFGQVSADGIPFLGVPLQALGLSGIELRQRHFVLSP